MSAAASGGTSASGGGGGSGSPTHLKAKFQIGSKRGRLNYSAEEKVFHPSDVPLKAKEARIHVHNSLHPDRRAGNGPLPWDYGTVAGPAKSGTKTMPWDDMLGWDDRHYASIETAALVEKAQAKMARIRAGKMSLEDDHPANINPRWSVTISHQPPKQQYLSQAVRQRAKNAAAAAVAGAGASGKPNNKSLNEKDIKRLVKTAVPINASGGPDDMKQQPPPFSQRSGSMSAAVGQSAKSSYASPDRPSLKERVEIHISEQRTSKQLQRLQAQHNATLQTLHDLHNSHRPTKQRSASATAVDLSASIGAGASATGSGGVGPTAIASKAERLNETLAKLSSQLADAKSAADVAAADARGKKFRDSTADTVVTPLYSSFKNVKPPASAASNASSAAAGSTAKPKPPRKVEMEHTGSYGRPNATITEECWSCCMASDRKAKGCTPVRSKPIGGWNWANVN